MSPWFAYHRGGWQIAVDAMNKADADILKRREFSDAVYDGEFSPPSMMHPSPATAFVTPRRQEQISATIRRQDNETQG
jgi:hypothetical protein